MARHPLLYAEPFEAPEWRARWSSGWTPKRPFPAKIGERPKVYF